MKNRLILATIATTVFLALSAAPEATAQVPLDDGANLLTAPANIADETSQAMAARAVRRPSLQVFRGSCDSFDWTIGGQGFSYSESISSVKRNSLGQAVLIRGFRSFGDSRPYRFTIRLSWDTFGCIRTGRITAGGKSVRF